LSEYLEVEVKRNSKIYEQKFSRGVPTTELKIIGNSDETGTTITFKPDKEIFDDVVFDFETLEFRFREMAFLNKGIKILLEDKRSNKIEEFHYEGGIKAFVEYINKNKTKIQENIMYFEAEKDNSTVELAMQYTESYSENIFSFANNIN